MRHSIIAVLLLFVSGVLPTGSYSVMADDLEGVDQKSDLISYRKVTALRLLHEQNAASEEKGRGLSPSELSQQIDGLSIPEGSRIDGYSKTIALYGYLRHDQVDGGLALIDNGLFAQESNEYRSGFLWGLLQFVYALEDSDEQLRELIHQRILRYAADRLAENEQQAIGVALQCLYANQFDLCRGILSREEWHAENHFERARVYAHSYYAEFLYVINRDNLRKSSATKETRRELKDLSKSILYAYEAAYQAAPNTFTRQCVASQWWGMNAHGYTDCDSQLLRKGIVAKRRPKKQTPNSLSDNAKFFVAQISDHYKQVLDKEIEQKDRVLFQQQLQGIAAHLDSICGGIIFDQIIEDIADDFPFYLEFVRFRLGEIAGENLEMTEHWLLWRAITRFTLTAEERFILRLQVEEVALQLDGTAEWLTIDEKSIYRNGLGHFFRNQFYEMENNPFAPSFARPLFSFEMPDAAQNLSKKIKKGRSSILNFKRQISDDDTFSDQERSDLMFDARRQGSNAIIYWAHHSFAKATSPTWTHLPSHIIWGESLLINRKGYPISIVGAFIDMPKFPLSNDLR